MGDWISIEDKLPSEYSYTIVYSKLGGISIARFTNRNSAYGTEFKEFWFTKGATQYSKKFITHWMPLPEPPQKQIKQ